MRGSLRSERRKYVKAGFVANNIEDDNIQVGCFDNNNKKRRFKTPNGHDPSKNKTTLVQAQNREKIDHWNKTVERLLEKRKARKRDLEEQGASEYQQSLVSFADGSFMNSPERAGSKFSKESRELFSSIEKGERITDSIEFQFASNFGDLKQMSTMVALT